MTQAAVKYFTPQEAQKTLPLVKQIVKDILKTANQIKDLAEAVGDGFEESKEVKSLTAEVHSFMSELEDLGCTYKDWNFEIGLVDFPSIINGREVLLCWRSDEDNITHYHGLLDGFAGRKLIPQEYL